MVIKKKIVEKIDPNLIQYETNTRSSRGKFEVTYAPSQGQITLNKKVCGVLDIDDKWDHVLVGYEQRANVLVIKKCDATEPGAVSVGESKAPNKKGKGYYKTGGKTIKISHVVGSWPNVSKYKKYIPERNGDLLLLAPIESTKIE